MKTLHIPTSIPIVLPSKMLTASVEPAVVRPPMNGELAKLEQLRRLLDPTAPTK